MHAAFLFIAEEFFEFFISLLRSFRLHNAHTIHHTMNMSIDTDKRHIVEMREDDFCCFDSHARESLQIRESFFYTFSRKSIGEVSNPHFEWTRFKCTIQGRKTRYRLFSSFILFSCRSNSFSLKNLFLIFEKKTKN